jgi:hypothetical protein
MNWFLRSLYQNSSTGRTWQESCGGFVILRIKKRYLNDAGPIGGPGRNAMQMTGLS